MNVSCLKRLPKTSSLKTKNKMIHGYVLLTVICVTAGFNIFTKPVKHFQGKDDNLFGQTIIESQHGVLVASPRSTVHCTAGRETCDDVNITENARKGLKPIVSAAKKIGEQQYVVCHQVRKQKAINEDLNGDCALLHGVKKSGVISPSSLVVEEMEQNNNNNNNGKDIDDASGSSSHREEVVNYDIDWLVLRQRRYINSNNNNNNDNDEDDSEEDAGTEIAFVLDGSGSIDPPDFKKAKDFISNIMQTVWKNCFTCEFAVVQYGKDIRTELSLLENKNGAKAIEKVNSINQIGNYTKTASAINHVLEHVFVAENGSKSGAKKMIIVITDGSIFLDPMNLTVVLNSPKMENVLRFAIGVGDVLKDPKGIKELEEIASDPNDQHLFMVNNYTGLDRILSNIEQSITGIEGIQQGAGFRFELAEAGFSSHFAHDGNLLFGAVGAYDWSGGLILRNHENGRMTFLNDTSTGPRFSYLGYSVTSALGLTETVYISGAPRHNLTGSVLLFNSKSHRLIQTLPGYQVGSYFGAVLCVLDFDKDGKTDYLLVGAPYYHVKGEEGMVYVYKLNQAQGRFHPAATEWRGADGHAFAMFGAAIADVGDVDGNRFNDVAVGAPLEGSEVSSSSGSIYIYNGYEGGIRPRFSQRIPAADVGQRLRFFGRSISGMSASQKHRREFISVGSEGGVTVLQALPVIVFKPKMTLDPQRLPSMDADRSKQYNEPINLKICFSTMRGKIMEGDLPILYQVDLDVAQDMKRVSFANGVSKADIFHLTADKECLPSLKIKFTGCHDCFSTIVIKLSFSLHHNLSAGPPLRILDMFSPTEMTTELPFQKDCEKCVGELSLSESWPSAKTIVVGHTQNFNILFNLTNRGEGSLYMSVLTLTYPSILLYSKVQPSDSSVVCRNEDRGTDREISQLKCDVMHPIMRRGTQVSLSISWQLAGKKVERRTTASILANLTCVNNGGQVLDIKSYKTEVRNSLKAQIVGKTEPEYLNVNKDDKNEKTNLMFTFKIYGENKYNATLFVNIHIHLQAAKTELSIIEISKGKCVFLQGRLKALQDSYRLRCEVGELQDAVVIEAEASVKHVESSSEMITANATLEYEEDQYEIPEKGSHIELVQVSIMKPETVRSAAALIGGSIGGLLLLAVIIIILIKCGFFRSRYSVDQADGAN